MTVSSTGRARPASWLPRQDPPEAEPGAFGTPGDAVSDPERVRMIAWVRGTVQGVGFRWFTREAALGIGGLEGCVSNLADGRVQVTAEGARRECALLLEWLRTGDTPGRVSGVTEIYGAPRGGYGGFAIR
jgi:acylphosphatase